MSKIVLANLDDVNSLKEEKANKTDLAKTDRSLDLLWKLNKGQTYDFESVTSVANEIDVPSGAVMGSVDMLGGKSVVVNQIDTATNLENASVWAGSYSKTNSAWSKIPQGHKIYAMYSIKIKTWNTTSTNSAIFGFTFTRSGANDDVREVKQADTVKVGDVFSGSKIFTTSSGNTTVYHYGSGVNGVGSVGTCDAKFNIIDLTQMFGSGNEPTLEECNRIFTEYIPYNEGTIVSAEYDAVESKGANLWDEEWEMGTILPSGAKTTDSTRIRSKNVYISSGEHFFACNYQARINYYGADDSFISSVVINGNASFTVPNGTMYAIFSTVAGYGNAYKNDIAIIKGASGSYSPYKAPIEHPLPTLPTLYGINDDVYDYVDFEPVTYKNMKSVDLGSLTWNYISNGRFYANLSTGMPFLSNTSLRGNALNNKYHEVSTYDMAQSVGDMGFCFNNAYISTAERIYIIDRAFTDATSFKDSLQGVILHYEAVEGGTDYNAKLLHKLTNIIDLGYQEYSYGNRAFTFPISTIGGKSNSLNFYCPMYKYSVDRSDLTMYFGGSYVNIFNDSFTDAGAFKTAMSGVQLLYELATEQILDVTDIIADFDNTIEVEAHGTLTFKNTEDDSLKIPIPNTMEYVVKLSEV